MPARWHDGAVRNVDSGMVMFERESWSVLKVVPLPQSSGMPPVAKGGTYFIVEIDTCRRNITHDASTNIGLRRAHNQGHAPWVHHDELSLIIII